MSDDLAEVQRRLVHTARSKARFLLGKAFDSDDWGLRVEREVWNWNIERAEVLIVKRIWFVYAFRMHYLSKVRSLLFNLSHPQNGELRSDVVAERVTLQGLVTRRPAQLFPLGPAREGEVALQHRDEIKEGAVPEGLLTCRRCKSRRVLWMMIQTRKSDEASTVFAMCSQCKHRWRTT